MLSRIFRDKIMINCYEQVSHFRAESKTVGFQKIGCFTFLDTGGYWIIFYKFLPKLASSSHFEKKGDEFESHFTHLW